MNVVLMDRTELISFTSNFVGKISGSTAENPNIFSRDVGNPSLTVPGAGFELLQANLDNIKILDTLIYTRSVNTNLQIAQNLFSFNLISLVERRYGTIPSGTTAGKVAWLKVNVISLVCNWYGYGSSPLGNKAIVQAWRAASTAWSAFQPTNLTSSVVLVSFPIVAVDIMNYVDSTGFCNFIASAEASNGTTASVINTDYVELVTTLYIRQ